MIGVALCTSYHMHQSTFSGLFAVHWQNQCSDTSLTWSAGSAAKCACVSCAWETKCCILHVASLMERKVNSLCPALFISISQSMGTTNISPLIIHTNSGSYSCIEVPYDKGWSLP